MKPKKRIGILTGGGDCPGLNAVIRAVSKKAMIEYDMQVIGFEDSYDGLLNNRYRELKYDDVSGILTLGGTILGTSKIANPYRSVIKSGPNPEFKDRHKEAIANFKKLKLQCLVVIGGDGTLTLGSWLNRDGIPVVGVPKTIDNDIKGTDVTFGFDSAVAVATEAIDRVHSTAQSHHRVMIVEVMGHKAGWIALHSGVAGGGDIILLPEIPYDVEVIAEKVRQRHKKGKRFSIIVIAEGATPKGGQMVVKRIVKESADPVRLGGIGFVLGEKLEKMTGFEIRAVVLGHLQRGGTPTAYDRVLSTRFGARAVDLITNRNYGHMVGIKGDKIIDVPLEVVAGGIKKVPKNHPLVKAARAVGTCFGDIE
jgi:phosphofructokinase-like protein